MNDIETYGLHVIQVMEDESGPGFGYSIGLFKTYKHPEIIIVGLRLELIHDLINGMAEDIKNGKSFEAGHFYGDIIEGFDCYFTLVDSSYYREYLGYAQWYYKDTEFPVLQCIYPTVKGIYPWQSEWPEEIKDLQPVLGSVNIR